jgi:hypothetical protein
MASFSGVVMPSRRLLLLLPLVLLNGCLYGIGRCTYEIRVLKLSGTVPTTIGGQLDPGLTHLTLGESKGSSSYRTLAITVSTFKAGAISSVELRDKERPTAEPILVATGFPDQPGSWSANMILSSGTPSHFQLEFLGKLHRLELVIHIGPEGNTEILRSVLEITSDEGWTRPYCD